jgi:hypothetical protein
MATIDSVTKSGINAWEYTWSGTSPFNLYLDWEYLDETSTTDVNRIVLNSDNTEPPILEVLDANDTTEPDQIRHGGRAVLQWRDVADTDYYVIEEKVSSVWTELDIIGHNSLGYNKYITELLDDETTAQFRVTATALDETAGEPVAFDLFVVRNPDPPDITLSYSSSGGEITIAAST